MTEGAETIETPSAPSTRRFGQWNSATPAISAFESVSAFSTARSEAHDEPAARIDLSQRPVYKAGRNPHTGTGVNASIGDEMTARAFTCTDVSPACLHARVSRMHVRRIAFAHEVHDFEAIQ